jgi:lysophospholipase
MTCTEHLLTAADGTSLFVRDFPAQTSSNVAQRVLLVVHGAAEHGGRYLRFAELAARAGWRVLIPDLRGHGLSGGIHVHVDHFSNYLVDLEFICKTFDLDPRRTACLGHSLGGLIVARFVQTKPDRTAVAVLLSPLFAVAIHIPRITSLAGRILSVLFPRTRFRSRIHPADLTRDPDCIVKRREDPLMRRGVTARWFVQMQQALQNAFRDAPDLRLPLLIFHAGEDRVADPLATQRWAEEVGSRDKKLRIFPEHLHELLNEPDGPQTAADILEWLNQRIPSG